MAQSTIPGVLPSTDEYAAAPHPTVKFERIRHTGTDALPYDNPNSQIDPLSGNTMQVMTWDEGNEVYLSWDFFQDGPSPNTPNVPLAGIPGPAVKGYLLLAIQAPNAGPDGPDPDVVLAYHDNPATNQKELYANLLYISDKHTQYAVYLWNATARTFRIQPGFPVQLGDARYTHSYPNIDANSDGLVAITWQQTITDRVTVTVVSTSNYFPSYTTVPPLDVTFGRSVLAAGDVTGQLLPCYRDPQRGHYGVYVRNPPKGLLEQTLHPDVAISEGNDQQAIISSTYIRHYVDGRESFSIVNELDIVQTRYNVCQDAANENNPQGAHLLSQLAEYSWPYSNNDVIGSPRIAATPLPATTQVGGVYYDTDVEVAVDRTRQDCGPTRYDIWNFGKSAGAFRSTYTLISPIGDPNLIRSVEPAIAYSWPVFYRTGYYIPYTVSWTGGAGYKNGDGDDIWAATLNQGTHVYNGAIGPLGQPAYYSRVNLQGKGTQAATSIAGRHLIGDTVAKSPDPDASPTGVTPGGTPHVHLWFDARLLQASYRRSGPEAGGPTPLRPATGATPLLAYPNPSEGEVGLRVQLHNGEKVRSYRVFDGIGRPVADLPVSTSGDATWRPDGNLPAGVYTVRATTTERTVSTKVTRK